MKKDKGNRSESGHPAEKPSDRNKTFTRRALLYALAAAPVIPGIVLSTGTTGSAGGHVDSGTRHKDIAEPQAPHIDAAPSHVDTNFHNQHIDQSRPHIDTKATKAHIDVPGHHIDMVTN